MLDVETRNEFRDVLRRGLATYPDALGITRGGSVEPDTVRDFMAKAVEGGWLGLGLEERFGGLGFGMAGATLLATEAGRAAVPGPLMAGTLLLPTLSGLGVGVDADMIEGVMAGTRLLTTGTRSGFDGDRRFLVEHAAGATDLLLVEETGTSSQLRIRILRAEGLASLDAFDPTSPMAALEDDGQLDAQLDVTLERGQSERLLGAANLWIAAELLGVAEQAGELSVAHAGERKQFGQLIGSYQGVKHRIVDDYVLQQNAAAVLLRAVEAWDRDAPDAIQLGHAARVASSEAAQRTSAFCIQVHGAIGFSWEHTAHIYYKRVRRLVGLLGTAAGSRAELGRIILGKAA